MAPLHRTGGTPTISRNTVTTTAVPPVIRSSPGALLPALWEPEGAAHAQCQVGDRCW